MNQISICETDPKAARAIKSAFNEIFSKMDAPDYPSHCDGCSEEGTNESMLSHECPQQQGTINEQDVETAQRISESFNRPTGLQNAIEAALTAARHSERRRNRRATRRRAKEGGLV